MKRYICILATVLLFASCKEKSIAPSEPENLVEMSFSASSSASSRSGFDGVDVVWKAEDKISIFDASMKNRRFVTKASGASALFTGRAKESATYYALYPYMTENSMAAAGVASALIPIRQKGVTGSWADSVNVSMGKLNGQLAGGTIRMKNVGGYIKVVVPESTDKIVSISLRAPGGEAIAGGVSVDCTGEVPVATPTAGSSSSISLMAPGGSFAAGTYYMVAVPTELSGGLEISLRRSDDYTAVLKKEAAAITRNSATGTTFTLDPAATEWHEPVKESIHVAFLTESLSINQPFTENMPAVGSPASTRSEETYYLKEGDFPFFFSATHFTINTTTGLRMGSTGDYIILPAVPGKRLEKVSMEFGLNSATASYTVGIYTDDAVSVPVAGGEDLETGIEAQGKVLEWTLTGTDEGARYRLRRGSGGTNFRIRNLTLQYSGHDVATVTSVKITDSSLESGTGTIKGTISAMHPESGVINWGVEYRRESATLWTAGPTGEGLSVDTSITGLENDNYFVRIWAKADSSPAVYSPDVKLTGSGPLVLEMLPFNDILWIWGGSGTQAFPTADSKKTTSDQKGVWDYWTVRGQYTSGFYPWNLNNKTPLYAYDYWGDANGYLHLSSRGIMLLPAIPQYRLVHVALMPTQSKAIQLSLASTTTAMKINGADVRQTSSQNVLMEWDLKTLSTPTAANTPYYLCHNTASGELVLSQLTLTYESAL